MSTVVAPPLLERLAAAEFGPREALNLRHWLAVSPEDRKELDEMLRSFAQKLEPNLPAEEAAVRRGAFLWALGRDGEAEDALRHRRQSPLAGFLLGRIRMARGELKEAAELFAAAAAAGDNAAGSAPAAAAQAECLRRLDRHKEAAEAVAKAARKAAGTAEVLYMQGRLAEDDGDQEKALESYEAALKVAPDYPEANFRSAWLLDLRGLDREALERYRRVAGETSLHLNALVNLGLLYDETGDFEKAAECFEQVLRLDPLEPRARLYLTDTLASTEMYYDEAQEKEQERMATLMRTPISDFELSVRSRNCLTKLGVKTLGEMVRHTEEDLLAHKNFGETSLQEVKDLLTSKGLYLGMGRADDRRRRARFSAGGNPLLARPVFELGLSARARSCMVRLGITTIGELVAHTERELLGVRNFGQTSLRELRTRLAGLSLSFKSAK